MSDDLAIQRLIQIQEEVDVLTKEVSDHCECDRHLEIKIRQFGGGKHYVEQCNVCGEQRGGSLKRPDALKRLGGCLPRDFDTSIEVARRQQARIRNEKTSELLNEASRLKLMIYRQPDWRAQRNLGTETRKETVTEFSQYVDGLVQKFGEDATIRYLLIRNLPQRARPVSH